MSQRTRMATRIMGMIMAMIMGTRMITAMIIIIRTDTAIRMATSTDAVMAGLVPAINVLLC